MKLNKLNNKLMRFLGNLCKTFWGILTVFEIGLIGALAGMQSEHLIYLLNEPLGLNYAHYASYFESALIGLLLSGLVFNKTRNQKVYWRKIKT